MKKLELVFKSEDQKVKTLRLNYVSGQLDNETLQSAMNRIGALKMFKVNGMNQYQVPVAARYIDTNSETIFDTRNEDKQTVK
ncbi:DUF2922 domain-containing protein [Apilactobacillus micheneri]|uniref:DUF2922 domain-containing protein n=1 Tax=Apilactobacillus micheneri TaxID=1899430 RepID=A0ABY2YXV8_9LACO|nr:DUF2922 domain-containing protein [Apilactobacillus micheneri]TPR26150.1 DUF2922 domain-containing protein [Apilactobacillus micheneri]TPR26904.1 DUF2922 domain-containing protein [Apilactobacillus micheneri]TPR27762.1 DUF2922 domain-containing protein [Apilactobacillus micheneri]TPR31667.1 DUF2922 domain-containing protein [Apilactobacillus micheneri]TPR32071.1 DUF2922 domain-containing protein [Apilactobacillus micheneri]